MAEDPRNMPTTADYAAHDARQALERGASLAERVMILEEAVARLQRALSEHLISSGASAK